MGASFRQQAYPEYKATREKLTRELQQDFDRSVERMTYTPVETWQVLSGALQKVGMSAAEAAAVMGDNMLRVAGLAWQRACP